MKSIYPECDPDGCCHLLIMGVFSACILPIPARFQLPTMRLPLPLLHRPHSNRIPSPTAARLARAAVFLLGDPMLYRYHPVTEEHRPPDPCLRRRVLYGPSGSVPGPRAGCWPLPSWGLLLLREAQKPALGPMCLGRHEVGPDGTALCAGLWSATPTDDTWPLRPRLWGRSMSLEELRTRAAICRGDHCRTACRSSAAALFYKTSRRLRRLYEPEI